MTDTRERRICRECGYGFYWPFLCDYDGTMPQDLCFRCGKASKREPREDFDPCTEEDMLEISS